MKRCWLLGVQGQWLCPTCVYEGRTPAMKSGQQRRIAKARRPAGPQMDLDGLTIEELREAGSDPLLSAAQRKAVKAHLRVVKQHARDEKAERKASKRAAKAARAEAKGGGSFGEHRVHMSMPTLRGLAGRGRERNSLKNRRLFSNAPGGLQVSLLLPFTRP